MARRSKVQESGEKKCSGQRQAGRLLPSWRTANARAEWSCWDMCGRRPTPGPRRGAASPVVGSMERQTCGVQAQGRPQSQTNLFPLDLQILAI
ncbi:hypothetical protein AV530_001154 [Patagioenas fasciata monilis]|uniref:Uncharacterized protein n=1 Tax=Patagioenas fasciata monilis TaxID=372326 RepID=A0A1V4KTL8_PATFA|nr:hypothetical protein AV530_001154 [Patagioenas fasciata monilis]